jgi:hypothetical protein
VITAESAVLQIIRVALHCVFPQFEVLEIDAGAASQGLVVKRAAFSDIVTHIGDMYADFPQPAGFLVYGQRVVVILGALGIDRERKQITKIDPIRLVFIRLRGERRMRPADTLVPQEPLENGLDPVRAPEHLLDPRAAPAETEDDQVADRCVPGPLSVDYCRRAGLEERVADEKLAPAGELGD